MDITIDFFRIEDYRKLGELTKRSFLLNAWHIDAHLPRPLGGEVFFQTVATRALHENSNSCLVARFRQQPVGYIIYGVDAQIGRQLGVSAATIILFCVDESFQGKAIGERLLDRACILLGSRGVRLLTVGTDANNLPALTVYQRNGFVTRLNWATWRLYPGFHRSPVAAPFRVEPWSGDEAVFDLCRLIDRPLSWFRDKRLSSSGLAEFRRSLAKLLAQHISDRRSMALVAKAGGFFRERIVGMLVWEEDGSVEKYYNTKEMDKRIYRVTDILVDRPSRGQGVASQLLSAFCDMAASRSHCIEAWVAMDDWASINVVSKCSFRPVHMATVLHRWLQA
ncbi:MAG TPA: GNAT family N-acetyltransferase [Spirochaetota bacterium]|nr:GNAT family N-acetyltransferase [Spirochaetota bacterium]